jgi:biotin transport system substrate-specific component
MLTFSTLLSGAQSRYHLRVINSGSRNSWIHGAPALTLYAALTAARPEKLAIASLVAVAGSILLTLSAKISIPFYPVPLTMTTFVVIGLGLALGARLGSAAVALYLFQGALGLPVFAGTPEKGIGLAYMMGPTGGYLLGYLVAAYALARWRNVGSTARR